MVSQRTFMTEAEQLTARRARCSTASPHLRPGPTAVLHWPGAQDFSGYLSAKRKGFVGREWLSSPGRLAAQTVPYWSSAPPGFGKSAIVSEMVEQQRNAMGVVAWFCCRWDYPDQLASLSSSRPSLPRSPKICPPTLKRWQRPNCRPLLEKAKTGSEVGPRNAVRATGALATGQALGSTAEGSTHFDRCL